MIYTQKRKSSFGRNVTNARKHSKLGRNYSGDLSEVISIVSLCESILTLYLTLFRCKKPDNGNIRTDNVNLFPKAILFTENNDDKFLLIGTKFTLTC